ncbi:hypothetical protein UR09_00370 [Candidatus Nitromaritima sp. SCGC AAA799-A02]|nr:hypothetical protein UR09_00370 [Candidatus Nitromaritima sp. SCGC AAA799-A02]
MKKKVVVLEGLEKFCGMDKIHYSLSTSHRAWSCIARQLMHPFNTSAPVEIGYPAMALSLLSNMRRIFFTDMLGITSKSSGTF